jgi:ribosomal protein L23
MVMKGKPRGSRQRGRKTTYGNDWKKAVVTLAPNDKIELFEGV